MDMTLKYYFDNDLHCVITQSSKLCLVRDEISYFIKYKDFYYKISILLSSYDSTNELVGEFYSKEKFIGFYNEYKPELTLSKLFDDNSNVSNRVYKKLQTMHRMDIIKSIK